LIVEEEDEEMKAGDVGGHIIEETAADVNDKKKGLS
jgi:hypothetical protein